MAEPFLSLIQSQRMSQVLAPQLRQSLELLQVPLLELRTLVRQEMEQNPTLEEQAQEGEQIEIEPALNAPEEEASFKDEFEKLAKLDDEFKDYFNQNQPRGPSSEEAARRQYFLDSLTQPESLQQHLMDQLAMAVVTPEESQMGELLIGSVNEDGYLTSSLEELASSSGYALEALQTVLTLVQEFDPVGVAARDLRDCLLIQLRRLGKENDLPALLVRDHLEALGTRRFPDIARALKVAVEDIHDATRLIATLEPKPGRIYTADATSYVTPEVTIQKVDGEYTVVLNNDQIPRLHISEHYRQLMADENTTAEVKNYIRDKVRAGLFLIKSINQRQQTIYNIAKEIITVQREFFAHGISHLRPLTMAEVATVLGIHETTVSRAIANKYMQTPRGLYPLKFFFSSGLTGEGGEDYSSHSIKSYLRDLIEHEDPQNPFSDQQLTELLEAKGIFISRRTVAKYREELSIPASYRRRRH